MIKIILINIYMTSTIRNIPIANPIIPKETIDNIQEVLETGMIASGKYVNEFINNFLEISQLPYGVACNSGTAALHTALLALDIKPEDEIITTPFTFIASSSSIIMCGAKPIFCDINPDTFNIDPQQIEKLITPKTKAILVVHLFGLASDMPQIMKIAEKYNLKVIEDCAQAHLAKIHFSDKSKTVGSFGDVGTYSFYPTKNMTTSEGGTVVSKHADIINQSKVFIDQGQSDKYLHTAIGYNYRLTNISAAIGLTQLKYIQEWTLRRQNNAKKLTKLIKQDIPWLTTPNTPENYEHVFHQYVLKVNQNSQFTRNEIVNKLREKGIGSAIHYPDVIYNQPIFKDFNVNKDCPIAENTATKVFSIPVHPQVTEADIDFAVVGVGNMGKNHIRVLHELQNDVELIAVSDLNEEIGKKYAHEFGCEYYKDYQNIPQHIDAVNIIVPTSLHFEVSKYFLEKKKHVLIEKPITQTVAEAEQLIDIAHQNKLKLMVGHIERFNPTIQTIKKIINNPYLIEIQRLNPCSNRISDAGVILDLQIHDIDLALYLNPSEITEINVMTQQFGNKEDISMVQLKFANKCLANLITSRITHKKIREIGLSQNDSYITGNMMSAEVQIMKHHQSIISPANSNYNYRTESTVEHIFVNKEEPLKSEIKNFIKAIQTNKKPLITGEDGLNALKIAYQIIDKIKN